MNTHSRIKVLFSNLHDELLSDKPDAEYKIAALLYLLITDLQYTPEFPPDLPADSGGRFLSAQMIKGYDILVLGAPTKDLNWKEYRAIRKFLKQGGGLLLLCNSNMLMDARPYIEGLAAKLGIELYEYHNRQPENIDIFFPHALTVKVTRLQVSNIAIVTPTAEACPVAYVEITPEPECIRETVAACLDLRNRPNSGNGRIAVIGDVAFCSDEFIECEHNKQFIRNIFEWLACRNPLDIKPFTVTETVHLGDTGQTKITLHHSNPEAEPYVECILESDQEAIIGSPRRGQTIRAGKPVSVGWQVTPQNLGKQGLQCVIRIEKKQWSRFKLLPDMHCLAPGYLTLEILDIQGKPKLSFEQKEPFTVKGIFHASSTIQSIPLMKLECYEGLAYGDPFSPEPGIWNLRAIEPGTHRITLSIPTTGQTVSALVTVKPSEHDRRTELYIAYVNPLDAEIAGRLKHTDERLCHDDVKNAGFEIVELDDYIEELYAEPSREWLKKMLIAVKREKKRDNKLINQLMTYFYPTYQSHYKQALIPYDPDLVSDLSRIYPAQRKHLEFNFLGSEETDDINIKQHIAAYLLHEKYGHGFFYTQTRLGRQVANIERLASSEKTEYQKVFEFIRDSSIVVNEGFAAWLEITFLKQLTDPELRQVADQRHKFLILEATGFLQKPIYREFFRKFPPHYDSQYREGFEYLDFIAKNYNVRCAVEAFMIATRVNLGIPENVSAVGFEFDKNRLEEFKAFFQKDDKSLEEESLKWLSHKRLRQITDILNKFRAELELPIRRQYCLPTIDENTEQLKVLITNDLKGRRILR
ncbi:hypothetical protein U14_01736 [Candidatus Moduliflexus flocculans]|uniref:Uncharacterized protein n=1 Tax=Candidatus Moduliflexus flocculans TaxID=1499966 RepID=A0A0S6VXF2_9BACT|nr:hypothetical protein U14_01736 [Candidatus Moduliflexus flocculans]